MLENIEEVTKELFKIVSQIKGVRGVSQNLCLTYVAEVETEEQKINVEKVGEHLSQQARKYGFELEVAAATSEEIKLAQEKLKEYQQASGT